MVRVRSTGRFVYTERLERRAGETAWEYVRRSVRREARIRTRFDGDAMEVIVGSCAPTLSTARTEIPTVLPKWTSVTDDRKKMPLSSEVLDR
jgi:hypothetical protein